MTRGRRSHARLRRQLAGRRNVRDPEALARAIGRRDHHTARQRRQARAR